MCRQTATSLSLFRSSLLQPTQPLISPSNIILHLFILPLCRVPPFWLSLPSSLSSTLNSHFLLCHLYPLPAPHFIHRPLRSLHFSLHFLLYLRFFLILPLLLFSVPVGWLSPKTDYTPHLSPSRSGFALRFSSAVSPPHVNNSEVLVKWLVNWRIIAKRKTVHIRGDKPFCSTHVHFNQQVKELSVKAGLQY